METPSKKYVLRITVGIVGLLVLVGIAVCVISAFIPEESPVKFASRALKVDVPKDATVIVDKYDGPSIPLGDGYSWTILQIPPDRIGDFTRSLAASSDWKRLPLSADLAEDPWCLQPGLADGEIPIASASGFYFLVDDQATYNRKNNNHTYDTETPLCKRSSQNFIFGLFNENDGRLYVWSINT